MHSNQYYDNTAEHINWFTRVYFDNMCPVGFFFLCKWKTFDNAIFYYKNNNVGSLAQWLYQILM